MLANSQADPYLSQAVLDLQFGHSQRASGMMSPLNVLSQLQSIGSLHKRRPGMQALVSLRSPDIPSILVETGLSGTMVKSVYWEATAISSKLPEADFITVCVNHFTRIRYFSLRRRAGQPRRQAPRCRVR